jgi:exopolyphosphatase/pppGpp-phosphohydrolase
MTYLGGLLPGMDPARSAVIDIGGGSTEIISAGGGRSVDMGSVRFTERYLPSDPVRDEEFWACQKAVDDGLEGLAEWRKSAPKDLQLVAVAGTATTLGAWFLGLERFDAARLDGLVLSRGDLHRLVEELKWRTVAERAALPGVARETQHFQRQHRKHADDPNCFVLMNTDSKDRLVYMARKPIKKGEEITFHYYGLPGTKSEMWFKKKE